MTKLEIITEAGKRLADTSTSFLSVLSTSFDHVMYDLARDELLPSLEQRSAPFTIVADQRTYSTATISGLTPPQYPMRVLSLEVVDWGYLGFVRKAESNAEFERLKVWGGDARRGRFRMFRIFPNRETLEVWPPADAQAVADATNGATIVYLAPPTVLADGDPITQIGDEDFETLVWGLIMRCAQYKDETTQDVQVAGALYADGKARMRARRFNEAPGRIVADASWWL